MNKKAELLAPAGDWEAFLAAVENGADAVYFGGKLFNARQFAGNFDNEQLKKAIDYAHVRDVKVYLTVNTLISDSEMGQAVDFASEAYALGIDGIIVQDIGFAGLVRKQLPGLDLHASTQMTVYNLEGVKILEELGFKRAVLARELSVDEIGYIAGNTPLEIEIFVHGALCICYSGQCLMSSIIGGRSGNRGKCAQPCRLPFELVGSNGNEYEKGHLLSPKDLCSVPILDSIINSGVKSLKIEGRMKNPEYVATVVKVYRKYLDAAMLISANGANKGLRIEKEDMKNLTQIFNRGGFSTGYLEDKQGRDMMCFEKPKNWGIYLGEVISYDRVSGTLKIKLEEDLSIGDGVEIWNGREESPGNVISEIRINNINTHTATAGEIATIGSLKGEISNGNKAYKTSSKKLITEARETFAGRSLKKVALKCSVVIRSGMPVTLIIKDYDGNEVNVSGTILPEKAINRPLTRERILEQVNKTGATPFIFNNIDIALEENLSVPVSEINNIRRAAMEEMERKRSEPSIRKISNIAIEAEKSLLNFPGNSRNKSENLKISLFMYSFIEGLNYNKLDISRLYLPFSAFIGERKKDVFEICQEKGYEVFVWLPPVTRGNYDKLIKSKLEQVAGSGVDGLLIGNIGSIEYARRFPELKIVGDYSLNTFNSFSVEELAELNLDGITLSMELTLSQIKELRFSPELTREAVVYGRIPVMTSEYCSVGSVAGGHNAKTKCNEACRKGTHKLKDRMGMEFPVLCDRIDCRSTILNSNVLFAAESLGKLKDAGVDWIRLNISDEKPEDIKEIVDMHGYVVRNGIKGLGKYDRLVKKIKSEGFTKGHYFRGV